MAPPTSPAPALPAIAPAAIAPGGRAARVIVVLCFAITTVATALIYWRWANVTEPTSYVIVQGAEEHNGTVITISPENSSDVVMTTLSPQNHYAATIFLQPGMYTLTATQNGATLIHGDVLMAHRRWKVIQLRSSKPLAGNTPRRAGVS